MSSDNFNEEAAARELAAMESQNMQNSGNGDTQSMNDSISNSGLGSVNMSSFGNKQQAQSSDVHLGWIDIDMYDLPSKGKFYPDGSSLKIRSAKAAEIRHFSTMDESNLLDMEDKLNSIIESCSTFSTNSRKMSYKDLCEEDRIILLLKIRDLTFPEPENQIKLKGKTDSGKRFEIELSSNYLIPSEIDADIEKYYSPTERAYVIKTKSAGEVVMRPPTIGVMQEVTKYMKDQQQNEQNLDQAFIQILPYISHDWRSMNSRSIFNMEVEYQGWNERKYMVIYRLAEKMKIGVNTNLEKEIEGELVKAPLEFPGGIKSLFIISDLTGELL